MLRKLQKSRDRRITITDLSNSYLTIKFAQPLKVTVLIFY